MSVTINGIAFDNIDYDAEVDVLYLHVGDPRAAVDWSESAEGDGLRYGPDGSLVGVTILNARLRLRRDEEIVFTLPQRRVVATDFGAVFAHVAR